MKELLPKLLKFHHAGTPVVLTALIETRGSTPQKAGAGMLVFADGSQQGTLGGGCVEAEIKRTALESLLTGESRIATFQLDHDYGWDDGLICGGRMTALIEPILAGADPGDLAVWAEMVTSPEGGTAAIALDPPKPGQSIRRYLFDAQGEPWPSTVPAPAEVTQRLRRLEDRPRPYVENGIAYLPQLSQGRVVIVGAGHVGRQLAQYASDVDFEVWVVDDRQTYCNAENIPAADRLLVGPLEKILNEIPVDHNTFCVIVTRGHHHDETALLQLVRRSPRYLGMIGSRRKIRLIYEDLRREGIAEEQLAQVHAPIGLSIASRTVSEIAISIVAELIAARNGPASSK